MFLWVFLHWWCLNCWIRLYVLILNRMWEHYTWRSWFSLCFVFVFLLLGAVLTWHSSLLPLFTYSVLFFSNTFICHLYVCFLCPGSISISLTCDHIWIADRYRGNAWPSLLIPLPFPLKVGQINSPQVSACSLFS